MENRLITNKELSVILSDKNLFDNSSNLLITKNKNKKVVSLPVNWWHTNNTYDIFSTNEKELIENINLTNNAKDTTNWNWDVNKGDYFRMIDKPIKTRFYATDVKPTPQKLFSSTKKLETISFIFTMIFIIMITTIVAGFVINF